MTPKPMFNFFSGVKDSDDSPSDEAANNSPLSESEQVGLKLVRSNLFLFYISYFFFTVGWRHGEYSGIWISNAP